MLTSVCFAGGMNLLLYCVYLFICFFRHHTNPVGTEWKWKMDNPDIIVQGALENHYQMIKQFRGKSCDISYDSKSSTLIIII